MLEERPVIPKEANGNENGKQCFLGLIATSDMYCEFATPEVEGRGGQSLCYPRHVEAERVAADGRRRPRRGGEADSRRTAAPLTPHGRDHRAIAATEGAKNRTPRLSTPLVTKRKIILYCFAIRTFVVTCSSLHAISRKSIRSDHAFEYTV